MKNIMKPLADPYAGFEYLHTNLIDKLPNPDPYKIYSFREVQNYLTMIIVKTKAKKSIFEKNILVNQNSSSERKSYRQESAQISRMIPSLSTEFLKNVFSFFLDRILFF